mmetsp:Transcript_48433/g.144675  ORF Transcript_48433/g.144675 Transcript_48433/m.144675 type:complete len:316 (+) Transcript_48433:411-1358(+)
MFEARGAFPEVQPGVCGDVGRAGLHADLRRRHRHCPPGRHGRVHVRAQPWPGGHPSERQQGSRAGRWLHLRRDGGHMPEQHRSTPDCHGARHNGLRLSSHRPGSPHDNALSVQAGRAGHRGGVPTAPERLEGQGHTAEQRRQGVVAGSVPDARSKPRRVRTGFEAKPPLATGHGQLEPQPGIVGQQERGLPLPGPPLQLSPCAARAARDGRRIKKELIIGSAPVAGIRRWRPAPESHHTRLRGAVALARELRQSAPQKPRTPRTHALAHLSLPLAERCGFHGEQRGRRRRRLRRRGRVGVGGFGGAAQPFRGDPR